MRLIHTTKKAANRASMYSKHGNSDAMSAKRDEKREELHRQLPKSFGEQLKYVQRIFYRRDQFGCPCFKMIRHSVTE